MSTGIEWTNETWNPTVGCSVASPGCDRCYAAREAAGRLAHTPTYAGLAIRPPGVPARFTGEVRYLPDRLDQPLRWRKPRLVFTNSMSDLFHPEVLQMEPRLDRRPPLVDIVTTMVRASQHQFQVLTKRPKLMAAVLSNPQFRLDVNAALLDAAHPVMPGGMSDPSFRWPGHIWWGTSIESDPYSWRADHLRQTPGVIRWISAEPLLGPLPSLSLVDVDWLVIGAESGPGARVMDLGWARELIAQADEVGTRVFVKQLSAGRLGQGDGRASGRPVKDPAFFPLDLRRREWPAAWAGAAA